MFPRLVGHEDGSGEVVLPRSTSQLIRPVGDEQSGDADLEDVGGITPEELSAWIYDPSLVHTLEITMTQQAFDELYAYSEAYESDHWVEADLVYDGQEVDSIGVRLKGRWGSWRSIYGKAAFKIDFNHYVDGQAFYGERLL